MRIIIAVLLACAFGDSAGASTFGQIRVLCERRASADASDQVLRKELLRRKDEEQKLRFELIEAMKQGHPEPTLLDRVDAVDSANRAWLKEVIDKKGWPGHALVGFDGADAAWLLAQHADKDLPLQKQALQLLTQAVNEKNARPAHLAYLTDRVLCAEGKKQIYGTQFSVRDGKQELKPVEDEANVDKRRAEMGLPTLGEYRKQLKELYGK